jgi:hypothetical protein
MDENLHIHISCRLTFTATASGLFWDTRGFFQDLLLDRNRLQVLGPEIFLGLTNLHIL